MRLWFFNMCNSFFIVICHHLFSWYLSRIHFHFLMPFLVIRIIYTMFLITCYHSFLPYVPWRKGIIKPLYSIQIRKVLTYEIKTEVLNIFAPLCFSPFFCAVNKMRGNAPPCFPGGRLVKWKNCQWKKTVRRRVPIHSPFRFISLYRCFWEGFANAAVLLQKFLLTNEV